jgi:uncharacterized protein
LASFDPEVAQRRSDEYFKAERLAFGTHHVVTPTFQILREPRGSSGATSHTALRLLRPLAEKGDARAQSTVGLMYYKGNGVAQDDREALHWFRLAADQGDARAQFNLGGIYFEAQGVPQDFAEAAKWWRLAADQGYPQAQYNLGLWFAEGKDGSPDNIQAHMWLNLAAAGFLASDNHGRDAAIRNRDVVASKMTTEQITQAQRLARDWKPKTK